MTKHPMTQSSLERVTALAQTTEEPRSAIYSRTASILRTLAPNDDPVEKAYSIQGHLRGVEPPMQERILAAVEALGGQSAQAQE